MSDKIITEEMVERFIQSSGMLNTGIFRTEVRAALTAVLPDIESALARGKPTGSLRAMLNQRKDVSAAAKGDGE